MRAIVNISLPTEMVRMLQKEMKKKHFPTMSEFFRHLIRSYYEEKEAISLIRESQKEVAQGKGKVLKSLADLD